MKRSPGALVDDHLAKARDLVQPGVGARVGQEQARRRAGCRCSRSWRGALLQCRLEPVQRLERLPGRQLYQARCAQAPRRAARARLGRRPAARRGRSARCPNAARLLQRLERGARLAQHARRHARETRHLLRRSCGSPGLARSRAGKTMLPLAGFSAAETCVERALVLQRKGRQLEVVRREQRERAVAVVQWLAIAPASARPSKVEVPRPISSIKHQRLIGRGVQDGRGFGHLDHEGRLRVGQVVGGADACGSRPSARAGGGGRHVTADRCEQRDQRDLPHEGRLAAHVRPGDDEHAPRRVEAAVVGDEGAAAGLAQARLDDRMAPCSISMHGRATNSGRHQLSVAARSASVVSASSPASARQRTQRPRMRLQGVDHLVVEQALAGQGALLRRQRLVLERLQSPA